MANPSRPKSPLLALTGIDGGPVLINPHELVAVETDPDSDLESVVLVRGGHLWLVTESVGQIAAKLERLGAQLGDSNLRLRLPTEALVKLRAVARRADHTPESLAETLILRVVDLAKAECSQLDELVDLVVPPKMEAEQHNGSDLDVLDAA